MIPRFRFERRATRPVVWGHRGARAHVLENTLESFARAFDDGADGIELDVRTTRDGVVVVMHDVDLARVTSKRDPRKVESLTARELAEAELDESLRAPTLADVLDLADARAGLVNVELKHDAHDFTGLARGVVRLLRGRARIKERVILSSFEPKLLGAVALLDATIPRAFIVHAGQKLAKTRVATWLTSGLGAIALHPERTLCSPTRVAGWKALGLIVAPWTVNDATEAIDLARIQVDGIITDDPGAISDALTSTTAKAAVR